MRVTPCLDTRYKVKVPNNLDDPLGHTVRAVEQKKKNQQHRMRLVEEVELIRVAGPLAFSPMTLWLQSFNQLGSTAWEPESDSASSG